MDATLPYDIEAERATLGSILSNRDAISATADWLAATDFHLEQHAWIYAAALSCYRNRTPPDVTTVGAALKQSAAGRDGSRLDAVGGYSALIDLSQAAPFGVHVEHYGKIVLDAARLRRLVDTGAKIAALGYKTGADPDVAEADAMALLAKSSATGPRSTLVPLHETIDILLDRFQNGVPPGEPTGMCDYDRLTGGLHGGDLVLVAGRPGHGKSSLALQWADTLAGRNRRVDYYSLEMDKDQLALRQVAMHTSINLQRLRSYDMNAEELERIVESFGILSEMPLAVDDSGGLTVQDIRTRSLRRAAEEGPPALVVVDYLQLMAGVKRSENRVQEVGEISRGLKQLARELHVPIVALSQLSRAIEGRADPEPQLSDLRESGSLEQDADQVVFVVRPELMRQGDQPGEAKLYVKKHRNGPTGVIPLVFDGATTRFLSRAAFSTMEGY